MARRGEQDARFGSCGREDSACVRLRPILEGRRSNVRLGPKQFATVELRILRASAVFETLVVVVNNNSKGYVYNGARRRLAAGRIYCSLMQPYGSHAS